MTSCSRPLRTPWPSRACLPSSPLTMPGSTLVPWRPSWGWTCSADLSKMPPSEWNRHLCLHLDSIFPISNQIAGWHHLLISNSNLPPRVNSEQEDVKVGITFFADMTEEEKAMYHGANMTNVQVILPIRTRYLGHVTGYQPIRYPEPVLIRLRKRKPCIMELTWLMSR